MSRPSKAATPTDKGGVPLQSRLSRRPAVRPPTTSTRIKAIAFRCAVNVGRFASRATSRARNFELARSSMKPSYYLPTRVLTTTTAREQLSKAILLRRRQSELFGTAHGLRDRRSIR